MIEFVCWECKGRTFLNGAMAERHENSTGHEVSARDVD